MLTHTRESESKSVICTPVAADEAILVEERRASGRIHAKLPANLNGVGLTGTLRCTATDIGAGGMYVRAPAASGLAVGQRYEVMPSGPEAETSQLARFIGEGCYATVVRTERLTNPGEPVVGGGLRFDQPLVMGDLPPALPT